MNALEHLEDDARKENIDIIPYHFENERIKGLYCDGVIGISKNIGTSTEKTCILAEEIGHHHTTTGNIIDMSNPSNRKQERRARLWGYDQLIGLQGIINAYVAGCKNRYEMAEYLGVTEEFLQECIDTYCEKYGMGIRLGNYCVTFVPNLMVGKIT